MFTIKVPSIQVRSRCKHRNCSRTQSLRGQQRQDVCRFASQGRRIPIREPSFVNLAHVFPRILMCAGWAWWALDPTWRYKSYSLFCLGCRMSHGDNPRPVLRSVSIISIFEFSIWESQIRTNLLWMFCWHDVGFQCARVSAPNKRWNFGNRP